jgi:hypothetical protein
MPENWRQRKEQMVEEGARNAESRGKVYRELFESDNTQYN